MGRSFVIILLVSFLPLFSRTSDQGEAVDTLPILRHMEPVPDDASVVPTRGPWEFERDIRGAVPQALTGFGGGMAALIATTALAHPFIYPMRGIETEERLQEEQRANSFVLGMGVPLGMAAGVHLVGRKLNREGSYLAAYAGAWLGLLPLTLSAAGVIPEEIGEVGSLFFVTIAAPVASIVLYEMDFSRKLRKSGAAQGQTARSDWDWVVMPWVGPESHGKGDRLGVRVGILSYRM